MTDLADGGTAWTAGWARGLTPDPLLWVDEWADQHMRIARGNGAEYGRYRTDRTPYAREVMRALSPTHPARRVVAKVASQLFKTQAAINWLGAIIHQAPGNALVLLPTDKLSKRVSSRISKTIDEVPELAARVAKPRSRDSRNTMDTKEFDGGSLYITTAGSAANLAEVPCRYIYGDEVDRWEVDVDGEGSPIELAETRASTFGRNAKFYYTSSPTEEGASAIDDLYRQSDQREFRVPCPHCGERQVLDWKQVRWEDDFSRAWCLCQHCGGEIDEHHKTAMLAAGEWIATAPGDGETVGFCLSALYAPLGWTSWASLAKQFVRASVALEKGDTELMQVFYNTRLALTWDVVRERVQADQLRAVAARFPLGTVPAGALVLTAAVDVQGNRLEVLVMGWGPGLERWTVNTHVLPGDPVDAALWRDLDTLLQTPITNTNGKPLIIEAVAVDTGAYTQDVYDYARSRRRRVIGTELQRVIAIKGANKPGRPIISSRPSKVDINQRGRVLKFGGELWMVGVDAAKDWVYSRALMTDGEGAVHYSADLPDEFFEQLTAEAKRTRYVRGYKRAEWVKVKGRRNEALDLMVYNLAMAYHLELHRRPATWWEIRRDRLCPPTLDLFGDPSSNRQPVEGFDAQPEMEMDEQKTQPNRNWIRTNDQKPWITRRR